MNLEKSDKEIFEYVQREIAAWRNMEWAVREYAQLYQPGDARNGINILDATKTNFENSFQNPLTEF